MNEPLVTTAAGTLRGACADGVTRWLGIPYARAPRFAAPEPADAWAGTRDATRYGRACAQQYRGKPSREYVDSELCGEDCLHLNVWVPEGGAPGPKPVMVWIHGGAFMAGSTNLYDGARLAREADIIVVSLNYRLGILGFANFAEALGLPDIPSNIGLRDQIAGLEWVRDNIAAFGGDPGRVTICGQSAGSISVSLLMHAPSARGLFHAAIMQSGAVSLTHTRERSVQDARALAAALDVNQGDLETLRTMDVARLIEAQAEVGQAIASGIPTAPWFDGDLLPASLDEALTHDGVAPVPLLAGATRDEIVLFDLLPGSILPSRWDELESLLHAQLGADHADRVLAAYPRSRKGRIALASDLTFVVPTRHFAHRHAAIAPAWFYRFDHAHPVARATHGLDLMFVWPFAGWKAALLRGGRDAGRRKALGQRMRAHLGHFVRHHTPDDDWPGYDADAQDVRIYNLADRMERNPEGARMAAWAGRDVTPGIVRA